MDCETEISNRVEKIRTIFQASKELGLAEKNLDLLINQLNNTENEFCSIAFEGASMGIALSDFETTQTLKNWHLYNQKTVMHSAQTHAGLGWAIAQLNIGVLPFLKTLQPLLQFRVIDGYGYYDGVLRQRQTIKSQKISENIEPWMLDAYNQGIGRSIWYASKGNLNKLLETISVFPHERQQYMWVGVGVACSYVGGINEDLLKNLYSISGQYQKNLATGAVLAAKSRVQANSITTDVELACKIWCHLSAKEAMELSVNAEPTSYNIVTDIYSLWLKQIQHSLVEIA